MVSETFISIFCPSLSCSEYTSCISCLSDSLCGYCGDSGGCIEGDEKGPIAGVESLEGCASGFVYSPSPRVPHALIGVFARADYGGGGDAIHRSKEDIRLKLGELCESPLGGTTRIEAERITRPPLSSFGEVYRPNPEDQHEDKSMFDKAREAFEPDDEFRPKTCAPCIGTYPKCDCSEPEPEIEAPTGSYAMDMAMDYPATGGLDDFDMPTGGQAMTGPCMDAAEEKKEQTEKLDDLQEEIDALLKGKDGPSEEDVEKFENEAEEQEEKEEKEEQKQEEQIEDVKEKVDEVTDNLEKAVAGLSSEDDDDSEETKENKIEESVADELKNVLPEIPENPSPEQKETVQKAMDELKEKVGEVADVDEKEATSVVENALDEAVASNLQTQADDVQSDVENKIENNNNNNNDSAKPVTKELDSKMKAFTQSTKTIANTLGTQIGNVKEKAKGLLNNMKKKLNNKIETKQVETTEIKEAG